MLLVPIIIRPSGTNGAVIPFQASDGKFWARHWDAYGGVSALKEAGTGVVATISGHTMQLDPGSPCRIFPGATWGYKQTGTASQNQTTTLATFNRFEQSSGNCTQRGVPASPVTIDQYAGPVGCAGAITTVPMPWNLILSSTTPRVEFVVSFGALLAFVGESDSLCFPITMSNQIASGAAGGAVTTTNRSGFRVGHSGSVTLTLGDYVCP